jgi:hypothetical protein
MAIANTTLLLKKSATPGNAPSALQNGEIAINYADGKLYYKNNVGTITAFSTGSAANSFATVNANSSLILATSSIDTLGFVGTNGISIFANTTSKTVIIDGKIIFDKANTGGGGGSSSGYLANSVIFANSSGYLSNTANIQFFAANNTLAVTGNITANTATFTNLYQINIPLVVNDISNQFNGRKAVFPLRTDQTSISSIVDSKDVEVDIKGYRLAPYVSELRYPWITPYDSYKGFRIKGSNIIIYNAPDIGDQAAIVIRNNSASVQKRRYPFSATTIALGD